jgi:hypothetical protein
MLQADDLSGIPPGHGGQRGRVPGSCGRRRVGIHFLTAA